MDSLSGLVVGEPAVAVAKLSAEEMMQSERLEDAMQWIKRTSRIAVNPAAVFGPLTLAGR